MEPKGHFFLEKCDALRAATGLQVQNIQKKITGWIQKPFAQCFIGFFTVFFYFFFTVFFTLSPPVFSSFFLRFFYIFFMKPGLATEMAGDVGAGD